MSSLRVDRRSLRVRLLAWLSGIALVVTGMTWLLHGILLNDLARDFLGARLEREAAHAIEQLRRDDRVSAGVLESASRGFQVFHHLYVLRLGDDLSASDPRWQVALQPLLEASRDALTEVREDGQHLLVFRQAFVLNGERGVLLIGEDFSQVEAGLHRLHGWVGGIAAAVLVMLVALNLLAVNRGLIPLSRLRDQLGELRRGERERLSPDVPSELDGLVVQLNHFMDEIDARLQRSRDSVANLSHALKTPLAAVTQVLRGNRPIDATRRRRLLERLDAVHAQLDAELRRSRIAGPHAGRMTELSRDSERLIEMFRSLYPDKRFTLSLPAQRDLRVAIDSQDLSEMLGIVLDNAGKWATREVHCRLRLEQGLTILIEDDGPGVAEADMARLGQRGTRLDERRPGYGLGLAILHQLLTRYAGRVDFAPSPLGGLRVEITVPVGASLA
ncbi:ATP-binding protein [Halomonas saccharevitans]|uniref:histidine kinase n=1 Tax=Halomonas saccharevitans TaxID=416872 RepID=A0A1I6XAW9_9GAMM|nr:ATP-binding protein [Halomonas saccharevitans]SFT34984.1 Signal transduction histidine kinase [Halomonas saccharevitans]